MRLVALPSRRVGAVVDYAAPAAGVCGLGIAFDDQHRLGVIGEHARGQ